MTNEFIDKVTPQQTGTHYPATTDATVLAQAISLPPLREQERIVSLADGLLLRLDAARGPLSRTADILKHFRQSVLAAACSGRLTEDWRYEHPVTRPGWFVPPKVGKDRQRRADPPTEVSAASIVGTGELPQSWRWVAVDELATLVTDGDHYPPKRVPDGIPHLTARNVKRWKLSLDSCTFISEDDFERVRRRYSPQPGDVIITCVGTIGRTAIVPEGLQFSADRNLAVVRPADGSLKSQMLQYVLNAPGWQNFMQDASGSTAQPHFYLNDLRGLPIPLIPPAEQDEIVRRVGALF